MSLKLKKPDVDSTREGLSEHHEGLGVKNRRTFSRYHQTAERPAASNNPSVFDALDEDDVVHPLDDVHPLGEDVRFEDDGGFSYEDDGDDPEVEQVLSKMSL